MLRAEVRIEVQERNRLSREIKIMKLRLLELQYARSQLSARHIAERYGLGVRQVAEMGRRAANGWVSKPRHRAKFRTCRDELETRDEY